MELNRLKNGVFSPGLKVSKKAVVQKRALAVYIAEDAQGHIKDEMKSLCANGGVEVVMVRTMKELGQACKIQVNTAVAVLYA